MFQRGDRRRKVEATLVDLRDPDIADIIGSENNKQLLQDIEMIDSVFSRPNHELIEVIFCIYVP